MADNPFDRIARSQKAALGLVVDTVSTMVEMGRTGVTKPEEVLNQVTALAAAAGDLAASTARPLEIFLASQRQLAESVGAFAVLSRQAADVLEGAAVSYSAMVDAMEAMATPVVGMAQRLRIDPKPDAGGGGGESETGKPKARTSSRSKPPRTVRPTDEPTTPAG